MDETWIRKLAAVGARAPSADNSQPWQLAWDGRELKISFAARHQTNNVFDPASHATLLSVGAVAEQLGAALGANGMDANWRWPPDAGTGHPYGAVTIAAECANFITPDKVANRHTNRLAYRKDPLPDDVVGVVKHLTNGGNRCVLFSDRHQKQSLIRLVQRSSEARFCNQRLHEWLIGSLRFTPEEAARGDGLDIRTLGLPPGGAAFLKWISDWRRLNRLNTFGAYKLLALSEIALLAAAPALICIVGPSDTRSVIEAGRVLAHIWMDLNMKGVAIHPYYVLTDQIQRLREGTVASGFENQVGEIDRALHRQLELLPGETVHMILRAGFPKSLPVRSRRLPLAAIFVDTSGGKKDIAGAKSPHGAHHGRV